MKRVNAEFVAEFGAEVINNTFSTDVRNRATAARSLLYLEEEIKLLREQDRKMRLHHLNRRLSSWLLCAALLGSLAAVCTVVVSFVWVVLTATL